MRRCWSSLLIASLVVGSWGKLPLPDYIRPCSFKLSDKEMTKCATQRAREVIPHVIKGDPKYGVPPLDPFVLDRLLVVDGRPPLGLTMLATNISMYGIPNIIINTTTHQTNPPVDTYSVTFPEMTIKFHYDMSGRILLLSVNGEGPATMKLKNVHVLYQFDWKLEKLEDGEVYYVPQPGARLNLDVDGMQIHLENLFNGDNTLGGTTNSFLNQEWREVFDSLKPAFEQAISDLITKILSGMFKQVPLKEAFLDAD